MSVQKANKPEFEFENGRVARINRVSPTIAIFLRQSQPAPPPPIDAGTGDPNPSHPSYARELARHNEYLTTLTIYMMIDYGVDMEIDEAQAQRLYDVVAAAGADVRSVSPRAIYICHAVCSGDDEVSRLVQAIQNERVTEQEVQRVAESFRGDVEGAPTVGVSSAEITVHASQRSADSAPVGDNGSKSTTRVQ